jgi:ankyrin repeat protein
MIAKATKRLSRVSLLPEEQSATNPLYAEAMSCASEPAALNVERGLLWFLAKAVFDDDPLNTLEQIHACSKVARSDLILEFDLNAIASRIVGSNVKSDDVESDDGSDDYMYSFSFDEGVGEDEQTIEVIAFAYKELFSFIANGNLSQANLETLTFVVSAHFGSVGLMTCLLGDLGDDEIVDVSYDNQRALRMACRCFPDDGVTRITQSLDLSTDDVEDQHTKTIASSTWWCAREQRQVEVVKLLLADERVDPAARNDWAIRHASRNGHSGIVKLLLADERVDPAADANYAIQIACKNGHVVVVDLLLADQRVDPAANIDYPIRCGSQNGHLEVVKKLLADKRVDPAARDDWAFRQAAQNQHSEVVELLLADERVNPATDFDYAIRCASYCGDQKTVKLLLADERVDPAALANEAIQLASGNGHLDIVKLLMTDKRVDPSADGNNAIQYASGNGHLEVVTLLLAGPFS